MDCFHGQRDSPHSDAIESDLHFVENFRSTRLILTHHVLYSCPEPVEMKEQYIIGIHELR